MQIEVEPNQTDQRPANVTQVKVWNNTNQAGDYQLLPNGMVVQINANQNLVLNLPNNCNAFRNAGNVTLDIQWL